MHNNTSRFDRISRKYEEEDAYICGTGIAVSEVVSAITNGQSVDEVLAKYKSLELEDVHQALAYAVYDLHELILFWRSETFNNLLSIKGYADIVNSNVNDSEEIVVYENTQTGTRLTLGWFAKLILNNSKRAIAHWNFLLHQAKLYEERPIELRKRHFSEIQTYIEENLHFYDENIEITFVGTTGLQPLQYDYGLEYSILLLVAYNHPGDPFTPISRVNAKQISTKQVQISILRDIKSEYPINRLSEDINQLFMRELPHSIASRTIRKHGSELKTEINENSVTFSFELPIWEDEET